MLYASLLVTWSHLFSLAGVWDGAIKGGIIGGLIGLSVGIVKLCLKKKPTSQDGTESLRKTDDESHV